MNTEEEWKETFKKAKELLYDKDADCEFYVLPPSNVYAITFQCPHCKRTIKIKGGFIPETFICVGCRNKLTAEDFFKEQDKE